MKFCIVMQKTVILAMSWIARVEWKRDYHRDSMKFIFFIRSKRLIGRRVSDFFSRILAQRSQT
uniref:Putative ovule protein n=1 Tax=Solanum chacoense TaxID=4108 RepID=A0A0V0HJI9_SOLCH